MTEHDVISCIISAADDKNVPFGTFRLVGLLAPSIFTGAPKAILYNVTAKSRTRWPCRNCISARYQPFLRKNLKIALAEMQPDSCLAINLRRVLQ